MSSPRKRAVLVHGMGRTPVSMLLLAARLRRRGLDCEVFGYFAGSASFDGIAARLSERLALQPAGYVAVGHSLGGLLLREAISRLPDAAPRPAHLFLLGTPNHASHLAKRLRHSPLYRLLTGDSGQLLADAGRVEAIRALELPTTVIAGVAGPRHPKGPFGQEPNDGVVALSEARLEGAALHPLPALHTFLMNSARVADLIASIG
ncbi:MAG TPA: hypothetical protein VL181_00295 [Holophagaceae bacterium]|jgi:hypothetical protein|nr:hypothetical protein [Holophagaceae bacterium]